MVLPKADPQAKVGLDEKSIQTLQRVSNSVSVASRNFTKNVSDDARETRKNLGKKARSTAVNAAKATGEGVRKAAPAAAFLASGNPIIASAVEKGISSALKLPKVFTEGITKFANLFRDRQAPAQKTNKKLEEVSKNQTNQKGIFTDIYKVLVDIRQVLDKQMGIDREQLERQRQQELIQLERRREASRQAKAQARDEKGRFVKGTAISASQAEEQAQDTARNVFLGAGFGTFLGGLAKKIFSGILSVMGVKFIGRVLRNSFSGLGGFAKALGLAGIIVNVGFALKDAVDEWINGDESRSVWEKLKESLSTFVTSFIDNIKDNVASVLSLITGESKQDIMKSPSVNQTPQGFEKGDVIEYNGNRREIVTVVPGDPPTVYLRKPGTEGKKGIISEDGVPKEIPTSELRETPKKRSDSKTKNDVGMKSESKPEKGDDTVVKKKGPISTDDNITYAARRFGVDEDTMRRIGFFESSFDPNNIARDKSGKAKTSARGVFQVTEGTAQNLKEKYPNIFPENASRLDPGTNAQMAAVLIRDHSRVFRREFDRDPTAAELQLMHLLGQGQAMDALRNRNERISENVSSKAVNNNEMLLRGRTTDQVLDAINKRFERDESAALSTGTKTSANLRSNMQKAIDNGVKEDIKRQASAKSGGMGNFVNAPVMNDNKRIDNSSTSFVAASSGSNESTFYKLNEMSRA